MKFHSYAALTAFALAGVAHGQISLLDWSSTTAWSNGVTSSSYNALSGGGSSSAVINPLTYDFGGGLMATVTVARDTGVTWQNGTSVYGTWAPGVTSAPAEVGLFGFGIAGGSPTTGATLTFNFNQAVQLNSVTIGDLDNSGTRDLVSVGANSSLFVQSSAGTAPGISGNGTSLISLTGIGAPENNFSTSAPTAWTKLGSGSNLINSLTVSLAGGVNNHGIWVSDVTVSAIPEPSTYALILGCGTLALITVRRRWMRRA